MKLIALICFIGGLVALLVIVTVWIVTARQRRRPSRRIDASWSRRQKQLRRRIHWCQGATVLASSFVVLALLGVIMTAADDSAAQSTSSLALSRARRDARSRAKSESKTTAIRARPPVNQATVCCRPVRHHRLSHPRHRALHRHLLLRRQLHRLRRLRQAAVNQRPRRL